MLFSLGHMNSVRNDLERIERALRQATMTISSFNPDTVEIASKADGDPVSAADRAVNEVLREMLPLPGEGWLSEEGPEDTCRLECHRVWVVDPLDGTREFLAGVPEWGISIALVENGAAVAGGVCNPATGEVFLGAPGEGVRLNGRPVHVTDRRQLVGALVLASRSEVRRGEWQRFREAPFTVRPTGSVAYKLCLVAAGLADATWSLEPKHEWDVVAGVALVTAAGGTVRAIGGAPLVFNKEIPEVPGLLAASPALAAPILELLAD